MRKEERRKGFQCRVCQKTFTNYTSHSRHQSSCGLTKNWYCSHCSKKFLRKDNLLRHNKQVHKSVDQQQTTTAEENTDKASVKYQQHTESVHGLSEEQEDWWISGDENGFDQKMDQIADNQVERATTDEGGA